MNKKNIVSCLSIVIMFFYTSCGVKKHVDSEKDIRQKAEVIESLDAVNKIPERTMDQLSFDFSWDLKLKAPVHYSWVPEATPDNVYFQLKTGEIQAVNIVTGHTSFITRPLHALIKLAPRVSRVKLIGQKTGSYYDDQLFVIAESTLYCFDANDNGGELIWRYDLPFEPSTGPHAEGRGESLRVYIGDWEGRIQVISFFQKKQRAFSIWQWNLQAIPVAQPQGMEELVYVSDLKGKMKCFGLDREMKWEYNAFGAVYSSVALRGRGLYFGANDGVFHVLNRLSGEEMGTLYLDAPITRKALFFNNEPTRVYVWVDVDRSNNKPAGLYAITSQSDSVEFVDVSHTKFPIEVERVKKDWFLPNVDSLVGSSNRHLFLKQKRGEQVFAVDRKTGNVDWRWNVSKTLGSSPQDVVEYLDRSNSQKSIILVGYDGKITSYRIFGQLSGNDKK